MANTIKTRKLAPWQLRKTLAEMAELICSGTGLIPVTQSGDTFHIQLSDGSVQITLSREGGAA